MWIIAVVKASFLRRIICSDSVIVYGIRVIGVWIIHKHGTGVQVKEPVAVFCVSWAGGNMLRIITLFPSVGKKLHLRGQTAGSMSPRETWR
jgi:hypothetical protein